MSKPTCGNFVYDGDMDTLGVRWLKWLESIDVNVVASGMSEDAN